MDKLVDLGDEFSYKNHPFLVLKLVLCNNRVSIKLVITEYSAPNTGANAEEDFDFHGGSISVAYALSGKFKHSGKKGKIGGLKCKSHCFMPKYQYEFIDMTDHDTNSMEQVQEMVGQVKYIHLVLTIILILMLG